MTAPLPADRPNDGPQPAGPPATPYYQRPGYGPVAPTTGGPAPTSGMPAPTSGLPAPTTGAPIIGRPAWYQPGPPAGRHQAAPAQPVQVQAQEQAQYAMVAQTSGAPAFPAAGARGGPATATATARASASLTPPRRPSAPAPISVPSTPSRLRVTVGQVVCWQAALLVAVLGVLSDVPALMAVTAVVALALLVPTAVPWRGFWLHVWIGRRLAYATRRRTVRLRHATDDPRRTLLTALEPAAVLGELSVDNETVGTVAHPAGMTAVLEVQPGDHTLFAPASLAVPTPISLLPAAEPDQLPTAVQVIVQVEQPPGGPVAGVAESYRQLTGGLVPLHRRCWLAVQVRRTPEVFQDAELRQALTNAVKKARRRLRQEKLTARPLGAEDLLTAAATAARLEADHPGRQGVYGQRQGKDLGGEGWTRWHSPGSVDQASFRIVRWPRGAWTMDQLLLGVPAAAVTLSLAALRDPAAVEGDKVQLEVVIRLTAPADAIRQAGSRLVGLVRSAGGSVERLDGRQRDALIASMPFGGFVS